jgi:hypothetical protein
MKRSQAETDMQVAGRQEQVNRQQNGQTEGMGGCSRWQACGRQVEVKQVTRYSAKPRSSRWLDDDLHEAVRKVADRKDTDTQTGRQAVGSAGGSKALGRETPSGGNTGRRQAGYMQTVLAMADDICR